MFDHLSAALQREETEHGNMGQLVQAHVPSMQEFQTFFQDLSALDSNFIYSMWISPRWRAGEFLEVRERDSFDALPLINFLSKMSESHPSVVEVPVGALFMFPSTYLCEQGLSAMFCMKHNCASVCARRETSAYS